MPRARQQKQPDYFSAYWDRQRLRAETIQDLGVVEIAVIHTSYGNRIRTISAYNAQFVEGARALTGKWRSRTLCWHFAFEQWDDVKALCVRVFGQDNVRMTAQKV